MKPTGLRYNQMVKMSTVLSHDPSSGLADFGDVRAEFHALLAGCGLYDLSWRSKIALTGSDRVRWLNGMATNNVRDLAPGHGVYNFMLNAQGRIQADLYAFNRGESLLVDLERSQRDKVLQLFDHYIIADDVEVADVSEKLTAVGLTGPESRGVLERAGIAVPELGYLQFADLNWREQAVALLRSGEEAKESWQVWIGPGQVRGLWDALVKAGAKPCGASALNLFRISRGIPQFGVDIRDKDLPQETGQTRALNFTKGCYLGQEIVERIRSRGAVHRQFTAFDVEGPLPEPGAKILSEEKEVGEVTSSAELPLPDGNRGVGLGYLRREAAGKNLHAGTATLRVATLPIA
jgi:folate-binding protein YgfZ